MRILLFAREHSVHLDRFASGLSRCGATVGVLTKLGSGDGSRDHAGGGEYGDCGSLSLQAGGDSDYGELGRVYEDQVSRFKPTLILAGPITDCGYIAASCRRDDVPLVLMPWAFDVLWEVGKSDEARRRARSALQNASYLFADCQTVFEECEHLKGASFRDGHVMPWGIERKDNPDGEQSVAFGSARAPRIICCRPFEEIYAPMTVLRAFGIVANQFCSARITFVGSGGMLAEMNDYVRVNGLAGKVEIRGRIGEEELCHLMRRMTIYVSGSQCDGTSISMLQAMAARLTLVLSDIPSNREWIEDGLTGWLAKPNSVESFAEKIGCAIGDRPPRAAAMINENVHALMRRAQWEPNLHGFFQFLSGVSAP